MKPVGKLPKLKIVTHPDHPPDPKFVAAMSEFGDVEITPDRMCPRGEMFVINEQQMRIEPADFDWGISA